MIRAFIFAYLMGLLALNTQAETTSVKVVSGGKSYYYDPAPSHPINPCQDYNRKALTDGVISTGYLFAGNSACWIATNPYIITVDLGVAQPIRGVSLNTAASVVSDNSFGWPKSIYILVGDSAGQNFYNAGELMSLDAVNGPLPTLNSTTPYATHLFKTTALNSFGRYVSFVVSPAVPPVSAAMGYVNGTVVAAVDEVQVFGPQNTADTAGSVSGPAYPTPRDFLVPIGMLDRLKQDAQSVKTLAQSYSSTVRNQVNSKLNSLTPYFNRVLLNPFDLNFRSTFPLPDGSNLHRGIFQAQANIWRSATSSPFTVWVKPSHWDPIAHIHAPVSNNASLTVNMMQNEFRSAAFNIDNNTQNVLNVNLTLTLSNSAFRKEWVTVHQAEWTDVSSGPPVLSALPVIGPFNQTITVSVPSGMTRQIWLTFNPKGSGEILAQSSSIKVTSGTTSKTIPLSLRVYSPVFPNQPTLHLGGFDYTDQNEDSYNITNQNRMKVIEFLKPYYVDTPWAKSGSMPYRDVNGNVAFNASGYMTTEPNTSNFDQWVGRWRDKARQYAVFLNVGSDSAIPFNYSTEPQKFANAAYSYMLFWADHMRELGLSPRQLIVLLVDEPNTLAQYKLIEAWAKAIKGVTAQCGGTACPNTEVQIFEDPLYPPDNNYQDPTFINVTQNLTDVLTPSRTYYLAFPEYTNYYSALANTGKLSFYSCMGPMEWLDPTTYIRMQAWTNWQVNGKNTSFWSFGDAGGTSSWRTGAPIVRHSSSWNEYAAARAGFSPYFLDGNLQSETLSLKWATPGKHMEAIRESVEDFEYLVELQRRAYDTNISSSDRSSMQSILQQANSLLQNSSMKNVYWQINSGKTRNQLDSIRNQILPWLQKYRF